MTNVNTKRINDTTWEIPKTGAMRVPGRIIADDQLMKSILRDKAAEQVANVACLPGIVGCSLAMPDAHWGYGFPIGGVAATDPDQGGVISPGGVGYDINCGCRLMTTALDLETVKPKLRELVNGLFRDIPCGVGSEGAIPRLSQADMKAVLETGSKWAVAQGFGTKDDLETTEERGAMSGADATAVSDRALKRGENQLGTLGSGNHFAEIGVVEQVYDETAAQVYGLAEGRITLMIHSGSRGLGYQVCDDYLVVMMRAAAKHKIELPDRQLCCAPVQSKAGRDYLAAMAAAANYAWANRQIMMHLARKSLAHTLKMSQDELGARQVYDVCHNVAKFEVHEVNGERKRLCVHRKGATRSFPGSRSEVPRAYRGVGQPVLVPGDMGTGSYVFMGTEHALSETFGSSCHGAGRVLSRTAARKARSANEVFAQLKERDVILMARSKKSVSEEMPDAYKDIDRVADVLHKADLGRRVVRIRPLGVIKG